eukprot:1143281-Pelagomonas_calceolata.AAC.11
MQLGSLAALFKDRKILRWAQRLGMAGALASGRQLSSFLRQYVVLNSIVLMEGCIPAGVTQDHIGMSDM